MFFKLVKGIPVGVQRGRAYLRFFALQPFIQKGPIGATMNATIYDVNDVYPGFRIRERLMQKAFFFSGGSNPPRTEGFYPSKA